MKIEDRESILLVDDRPEGLLALEAALQSPEYSLIKANSGVEALSCLLKQDLALIIMDVQMPSFGTGVDAVRRLREHPKLKDVPVLLMTAMTPAEVKTLITAPLPKTWLLFKPPRWQAVLAHVAQVIGPPENTKPPA